MKGFAYVAFESVDEARGAREKMNGAYIAGRNIRLDYAAARTGGGSTGRPNPPSVKLFVGNFSDDATEDMLREMFQVCGTITDVYVPKDGITGLNKGHAYVSFSTVEEAMTAYGTLNDTDLAGNSVRIDYAEVKPRPVRAPVASAKAPSLKLFVGSVSESATEDDLRELFRPCGELTDVYVPKNADTGAGRGFAFVSYLTVDEATAARNTLNGAELLGKSIRLDYAEVKEPGGGGGGGVSKPPSFKLFLGNISQECSEDHLREAFGAYGEITDCFLPKDENGGNKGIAFLSFSSVDEARTAKDALDKTEVAGDNIRIDFAEIKERASKGGSSKEPSSKLFIGNISDDCTEEYLREAFGVHGEITDCYIPQDNGMNKGIAFLSFSSVEETIAAKDALDGTKIAGGNVRLDFSELRERAGGGGGAGGGSRDPSLKLFIGNISEECTEDHLRGAFGVHGEITDLFIPRENAVNKGIAFCSFSSVGEAIAAKESLNGTEIAGENIRIDFSEGRARPPRESSSAPSLKLFIGNVSEECTEEHLRDAFGAHGEVIDAYIPKDDNGTNKGIAFLSFSTVEEAIAAKDALHATDVAGENIRIDFAQVKGHAPRGGGGPNEPSLKLFIGGLSAECTDDDLREAFGAHGEVTDVFIPKDDDGANKGIGFVSFASVDEATAAMDALHDTEIAGETIRIDFAQSRERLPRESNSEPSLKLVLFGVSPECMDDDLREAFSAHGEVIDAFIPKDEDGANKGIGFVSFSSVDEATAAKDALSGTEIAGETVRIDFAQGRGRPPRESNGEPSLKLFIGGISTECTDDDLRDAFSAHGEVTGAFIPKDENGQNKGIAFVSFSSIYEALAAKDTLSGTELAGETIRIDFAQVKDRAPKAANNPPASKLFVGGVSLECNEMMLREFFAECGELANVYMPKNESGVNKGFAYVTFSSVEEATTAVDTLNGKQCAGSAIRLDYAEARERPPRQARPIEDPSNEPSNNLFVGGIPFDTTVEVIKAAFAPHGAVLDVRIPIDPKEKTPRGFCYVAFATMEEAMAAVQPMNGAEIGGRQIRVDFAGESDGDPNKPLVPNADDAFDPNEAVRSRLRERNTYIAAEVNVPDRFELFLLQEGEKKISEAIDTRKCSKHDMPRERANCEL